MFFRQKKREGEEEDREIGRKEYTRSLFIISTVCMVMPSQQQSKKAKNLTWSNRHSFTGDEKKE
jgi:hypothetical protein